MPKEDIEYLTERKIYNTDVKNTLSSHFILKTSKLIYSEI